MKRIFKILFIMLPVFTLSNTWINSRPIFEANDLLQGRIDVSFNGEGEFESVSFYNTLTGKIIRSIDKSEIKNLNPFSNFETISDKPLTEADAVEIKNELYEKGWQNQIWDTRYTDINIASINIQTPFIEYNENLFAVTFHLFFLNRDGNIIGTASEILIYNCEGKEQLNKHLGLNCSEIILTEDGKWVLYKTEFPSVEGDEASGQSFNLVNITDNSDINIFPKRELPWDMQVSMPAFGYDCFYWLLLSKTDLTVILIDPYSKKLKYKEYPSAKISSLEYVNLKFIKFRDEVKESTETFDLYDSF